MRPSIKQFVEICTRHLPIHAPIYEFGSYQVHGQEQFANLRELFPGKAYVGSDMRVGRGVDAVLNLHDLGLPSGSVGTALCLDTLEHVEYPHKACAELYRVIKPHGLLVLSSVMNFPIHDYPNDYWRFTPEAFASLLRPFEFVEIVSGGDPIFPHTVAAVACKGRVDAASVAQLKGEFETWRGQFIAPALPRWRQIARMLVPPIAGWAYGRTLRCLGLRKDTVTPCGG
ncbi:methyltransferase domain-containing protein [Candidatus Viridilinea mediisalina]|uniref:Methyltransferase type 11 domain-containing protein n=1 Tax=Candidatus Viridilinea mediisalina TaxID=2024553 RepID=A0A2A6RM09_9CHLR|nr:methyltransferase domain-containing protein [Candidatus Viridilinea mediisalina]PDW03890.1 hypothetical protein CJ255_06460 [Candidatus Viridilinea mediisalina]